jgi:nucleoside-diphosphate-sugar epimerase/phosphohistidine swiveling domain-containing protein
MRVVVTGASGDFGACIIPEILGRGHEVVGLSRRPHSMGSARYSHVCADIRDLDAVAGAMAGVDAVVHLAWTTHPMHDAAATRAIDVGGTETVLRAMERAGVSRLVGASSVMAYGANADNPPTLTETDPLRPSRKHLYSLHKAEAERLILAAPVNALLVRATNIMGRGTTGVTQEGFATPVILGMKGASNRFQFIHPEDLARFFADAVERADWRGPVNLAADGTLLQREVAAILGKRYVELNPRRVEEVLEFLWNRGWFTLDPGAVEAFVNFPIVDTAKLRTEFGFHPAWSSRACVEDFARTNRSHVFLGTRQVDIPWRWPWGSVPASAGDAAHRVPAADPGVGGEFDTTVDPSWSLFTAANTSEAFPGPMTPLSLELALDSLRAGGVQAATVLNLDAQLRHALTRDPVGAFGHGVYANMSVVYAMGAAMPGGGVSAWDEMLFGDRDGVQLPTVDKLGGLGIARRLPGLLAKLSGFPAEVRSIDAQAHAEQRDSRFYASLTDAELLAQLYRARDEVAHAWAAASNASAFIVPIMELIQKQGGKGFATRIRGGTEELASAGIAGGAYRLADQANRDPNIAATLRELPAPAALECLGGTHPEFVAELDTVLAEFGHRGPCETELANPVFADDPARLVDVVAKLIDTGRRVAESAPPMSRRLALLAALGNRFQRTRERVRDAAIRRTHQYRIVAREIGVRLADSGVINNPDDVFYLVRAELKNPPANAASLVERRRAERTRLERDRPPLNFAVTYTVDRQATEQLTPGHALQGTPVSSGVAKGRVRVLTVDSMDDLEPGEVLVTAFTDTGWTPYFSYAAAVVVDTGGEMSHAAVVAREFGIPCVVGTKRGSALLRNGDVVEVDGSTGIVMRVE